MSNSNGLVREANFLLVIAKCSNSSSLPKFMSTLFACSRKLKLKNIEKDDANIVSSSKSLDKEEISNYVSAWVDNKFEPYTFA